MSAYGTPKVVYVVLLVSLMQIIHDVRRIGKTRVEHVTFLEML